MFNDLSSPLALLETRRSGKPREMVPPGPTAGQLDAMLAVATRVPDHGKLGPWRFVVVEPEQRDALSELFTGAYRAEKPTAGPLEIEAMNTMARQGEAMVVVLFSPRESHIPVWEQELSCGAACMALVTAASASGFVASWITGWPAYSDRVRDGFGAAPERIAGFVYIGSPGKPLDERVRPAPADRVSRWRPA